MKKLICVLFSMASLINIPISIYAQIDSETVVPGEPPAKAVPGYVVLNNGDTLTGKLKWTLRYVENNPVEIKFTDESGNSQNFRAEQIIGFGFNPIVWMDNDPKAIYLETEHYLTMPSMKQGIPVFLDRMLNGRLRVFLNRSSLGLAGTSVTAEEEFNGVYFSFSRNKGLTIGPTYTTKYNIVKARCKYASYLVSKDNGALVKIDKDYFEQNFKALFGDCPPINEEVAKNPSLLKFRNFMLLAEIYNNLCGK